MFPYAQVGSWLYRTAEAASFAEALLALPEALCLPSSTDCALQSRKAVDTKEKFPKRKVRPESLSLTAEFLCWRILELFTFLTLLR